MRYTLVGLVTFFWFHISFAQSQDRVKFTPEHPQQGQSIKFTYRVDSSIFLKGVKVNCRILFTGTNDDSVRATFPKVNELALQELNGILFGSFDVPAKAAGLVAVFMDSSELSIDNNNGEGYWSPVFTGIDILPGSLSGIADLYTGVWPPAYNLRERKDISRKLYERDFELHPQVKRKFTRYYLATFDVYDTKEKERYRTELNRYAQFADLSESELLGIKRYYNLINENDSARKYEKLVFERFPNGSWALQVTSLNPAIQVELTKDHLEKWRAYKEFKEMYCKSYPDEFTRLRMNNRLGQLLRGMVLSFAQNNDLDTWEKEVDKLDEKPRYNTYQRSSAILAEYVKSSSRLEKNRKGDLGHLQLETPRLLLASSKEEQLIIYGEKLARESVAWFAQNLDAPREIIDKPYMTDKDIRSFRGELLAGVLDVLGQNLLLQNRIEEAGKILKDAVDFARRKDAVINEHYIEALVKSGHIKEAINESETMISMGKSTAAVNDFHRRMVMNSSPFESAKMDLRARLKKQMISEELPSGVLLNKKGENISIRDLKGKIIVIDFWATWCVPCIVGMQSSIEVIRKYEKDPAVVFLFVNTERITDETRRRVRKRLAEMDNAFESYFDPEYNTTKAFKVEALPTTCIIDKQGKVRFRKTGVLMKKDKQELSDELTAMIELVR